MVSPIAHPNDNGDNIEQTVGPIEYGKFSEKYISNILTGLTNTYNFINLYTVIASMLNQMYIYDSESKNLKKYIPESVYYIHNYTTNFNIKVESEPDPTKNYKIKINGVTINTSTLWNKNHGEVSYQNNDL